MKKNILGIKIDDINMDQALEIVQGWLRQPGKRYIVTPNPEFILAAQKDREFKEILNKADLGLPDSSRLGLSYWLLGKSRPERLLLWPLFFFPVSAVMQFDVVTGTDFMEALCKLASEKGFTTGFLGGKGEVAKRCAECLLRKYPKLKVSYVSSGGIIDRDGNSHNTSYILPATDILFVAFGHIKQEKWIAKNLENIPTHVAMGVGGAFDYFSGSVPRAPEGLRNIGFEWLFRLIVQPWRAKRQLLLLKYLWLIVLK